MKLNGGIQKTAMMSSNKIQQQPKSSKDEIEMFLLSTSIKGIPRVLKGRTLLHKTVWLVAVIVGFALGTYQLSRLIGNYIDYDVTTKLRISTDYDKFPDITLCTLGISGEQEAFQQYLNDVRLVYKGKNDSTPGFDWIEAYLSSPRAFFANKDAYMSKSDGGVSNTVMDCVWGTHSFGYVHCNKSSILEHKPNNRHSICIRITIPDSGNQMRTNPYLIDQWTGVINIRDFVNSTITEYNIEPFSPLYSTGVVAYIHPAGSLPEEDGGILISPGTYSIVSVTPLYWSHLPSPYSNCKSIYEPHSNTEYSSIMSESLAGDQKYSKTMCEHIYAQNVYISQCNCLSPRFYTSSQQRQNYSLCAKLELSRDLMEQRIKCNSVVNINDDDKNAMCPDQCEEVTYDKGISQVRIKGTRGGKSRVPEVLAVILNYYGTC